MRTVFEKIAVAVLPTLLAACGGGGGSTSTTGTTTPVTTTTYLGVATGGGHTVAIKSDGTLLAWGLNRNGQLGDGTSVDKPAPTTVGVGTAASGSIVSAGEFHTAALSACGTSGCTLSTWGSNDSGRLGDGTTVEKRSPAKITGTAWLAVSAGGSHTAAIKKDGTTGGTVWTWGRNDKGQLGISNNDSKSVPTQVGTVKTWLNVSAGANHTIGMLQTGAIHRWGSNDRGQLGIGSLTPSTPYLNVPGILTGTGAGTDSQKFASMAAGGDHNLAILNNGALFSWGGNGFGQLGDGTTTDGWLPAQIGIDLDWESVSAGGGHNDAGNDLAANGGHSLAIKTDGTLWAWGSNAFGQLGTGTTDDATAPTQVGTSRDWKRVSAGKLHSFAWKADGSLWGWGNNLNGQLGNGSSGATAKNILVPTRLN